MWGMTGNSNMVMGAPIIGVGFQIIAECKFQA